MSKPFGNNNRFGLYGQHRNRQGNTRPINFNISNLFIEVYLAYPASIIGREDIDLSNSIILPPSALQKMSDLKNFGDSKNPFLFQILNIDLNIKTHCGVI